MPLFCLPVLHKHSKWFLKHSKTWRILSWDLILSHLYDEFPWCTLSENALRIRRLFSIYNAAGKLYIRCHYCWLASPSYICFKSVKKIVERNCFQYSQMCIIFKEQNNVFLVSHIWIKLIDTELLRPWICTQLFVYSLPVAQEFSCTLCPTYVSWKSWSCGSQCTYIISVKFWQGYFANQTFIHS